MQTDFLEFRNQNTQPIPQMQIFNNFGVVAEGWYFVCPSEDLPSGKAKGFEICGQELVLFRGADKKVRALDAYCPHMGTHLGVGKVEGNQIRCFFHHWRFNEDGECTDVPCQKMIPTKAKVNHYRTLEKYDSIWVFPNSQENQDLADFPNLPSAQWTSVMGKSYTRSCHHHVTMINGIDPQHLKTVHRLNIEMALEIAEKKNGRQIDISLTGTVPKTTWKEKLAQLILGPRYGYSMRYDHANNGLLTLMQNVYLFGGKFKFPTLHMIFAYRPLSGGQTLVQPIYLTQKRPGIRGFFINRLLIFLTQRAFFALQGEDGMVYENMRFFPQNLLEIDRPITEYIQYVNKIPKSVWRLQRT
ncbi:MAG: aromatic ring-hydroxylating dioxygenase subunit alpha [Bdellovibrionota bacterium]